MSASSRISSKKRAKKRKRLFEIQKGKCASCRRTRGISGLRMVKIDINGSLEYSNLQLICFFCTEIRADELKANYRDVG